MNGREVRFTLQGDSSVAYTVTASRTAGSPTPSRVWTLWDSEEPDGDGGGRRGAAVVRPSS